MNLHSVLVAFTAAAASELDGEWSSVGWISQTRLLHPPFVGPDNVTVQRNYTHGIHRVLFDLVCASGEDVVDDVEADVMSILSSAAAGGKIDAIEALTNALWDSVVIEDDPSIEDRLYGGKVYMAAVIPVQLFCTDS